MKHVCDQRSLVLRKHETIASVDVSTVTQSFVTVNYEIASFEVLDAPQRVLCGRTKEISQLMGAYSQMCITHDAQKVIVHGVSGTGKTSLVDLLRKSVTDEGGFFASGKYYQNSELQEPYSAIMAALSDLCDLLVQSQDFMQERLGLFQQSLGFQNGHLLEKTISNLSPLLTRSPEDHANVRICEEPCVRNIAVFTKFMVACKTFLRAVSWEEHPIVLFIDDIHWMDEGSSKLIEFLMNNSAPCNVMMVLAYRDEEAASIADFLNHVRKENNVDIALQNLNLEGIEELISNLLGPSVMSRAELSDIVAAKTMGNPFHVIQLVQYIQSEGLMAYNQMTKSWAFDADKIRSDVMVTNSLVEMLSAKIRSIPSDILECLKLASLVGNCFTVDLLAKIKSFLCYQDNLCHVPHEPSHSHLGDTPQVNAERETVYAAIREALDAGFVEEIKEGYQFRHDSLQSAFQSTLHEDEKIRFHLAIGRAFLACEGAESLYRASLHFHNVPNHFLDKSSRIDVVRLHFDAATYCKDHSAFIDAAQSLHRGLDLIDNSTKWADHFDLTFEMTDMLARMELIIGNHSACTEAVDEIRCRAKTLNMMTNALLIGVECVMAQHDVEASISAALHALCSLGIVIPQRVCSRHLLFKMSKVRLMLALKTDGDILSMPLMSDNIMTTAVRILVDQSFSCMLKDEPIVGIYSALLALELTLKHGLNPYAASAISVYGVALLRSGFYRNAYRYGKLALTLLDKINSKEAACSTMINAFVALLHWYEPLDGITSSLRRVAFLGFEVGDIIYGTHALSIHYEIELFKGTNLELLDSSLRADIQFLRDSSQDCMFMILQAMMQYVANMRSQDALHWHELISLNGEFINNEDDFFRQAHEINHRIAKMRAMSMKAILACTFGFWSMAESMCIDLMRQADVFSSSFNLMPISLFGGIASYSCYIANRKRKHLKLARKNRTTLRHAAKRGCPNAPAFLALLDAEDLAIRSSSLPSAVGAAYMAAVDVLFKDDYPNIEGLAFERAAFFHARVGNYDEARDCLRKALEIYEVKWGAIAKQNWLAETMEEVLGTLGVNDEQGNIIGSYIALSCKTER